METITIFIDAEYLLQSLRELKDSEKSIPKDNFDFAKFIDFLLNGRKINSVYYYTARLDKNENPKTFDEQTEFLNNIKNSLNAYNVNIRLGQMIKTKIKNQSTWNKYRKAGRRRHARMQRQQRHSQQKKKSRRRNHSKNYHKSAVSRKSTLSKPKRNTNYSKRRKNTRESFGKNFFDF